MMTFVSQEEKIQLKTSAKWDMRIFNIPSLEMWSSDNHKSCCLVFLFDVFGFVFSLIYSLRGTGLLSWFIHTTLIWCWCLHKYSSKMVAEPWPEINRKCVSYNVFRPPCPSWNICWLCGNWYMVQIKFKWIRTKMLFRQWFLQFSQTGWVSITAFQHATISNTEIHLNEILIRGHVTILYQHLLGEKVEVWWLLYLTPSSTLHSTPFPNILLNLSS